ncbi:MAG: DegV family protein [Eubacteriales bacterium]|nr:DegV family protein [Eubacteriales bacterium]
MAIHVITDSASDILENEYENLQILPMTVTFGEYEYQDGLTLGKKEFYEKLIESDTLPITSQITPFGFEEAILPYVEAGEQVLLITLSGKLSGTWQNAAVIAEDYPNQVYVVDSENASIGQRILIECALRMIKEEKTIDEIVTELNVIKKKIHFVALLDTLEYLKKGGRISKAAAIAGGLLSIKPVIAIENGEVNVLGKARGSKQGNNLITEQIKKYGEIDFSMPYYLAYTGLSDEMIKKYQKDNAHLWENEADELPISIVGCAIGTHIGPGAIGVAWIEK